MSAPQIVWLRRDLRLADQPALAAAAEAGPVVPVYVLDDERAGDHAYGEASLVYLHMTLVDLAKRYEALGTKLILRKGDAPQVLAAIADEIGASAIHAIRHYEPWWKEAEDELHDALGEGCELHLYDGNYLLPPGTLKTGSGKPYKIYSPFCEVDAGDDAAARRGRGTRIAGGYPTSNRRAMRWTIGR